MGSILANGFPVSEASISLPRTGAWHADLVIPNEAAASIKGALTITVGDSLTYSGTVSRAGAWEGRVNMRVIGGRGGLPMTLPARAYQNVPVSVPLNDILVSTGESLDPTADSGALSYFLPFWNRIEGTAGLQLSALLDLAFAQWRIGPSGLVWFGADTYKPAPAEAQSVLTWQAPNLGLLEFAADVPDIQPGQTINGKRIDYVTHTYGPNRTRSRVWVQ